MVTKPKSVQVKEVNQGRVLHTHQQEEPVNLGIPMNEDLKIRRKRPIVRDNFRHGDMNLIKEVLKSPMTQLDARQVTKLDIFLPPVTH